MKRLLYPGSFDPPTLGHLDLIQRASRMADHLYIAVACNSAKRALFSAEERVEMLRELTASLIHVEVVAVEGLVADFAVVNGVQGIVRGLRSAADCDGELLLARANRQMVGVETLLMVANPDLAYVSSTVIKEIARSGHHLEQFLPQSVIPKVYKAVASNRF